MDINRIFLSQQLELRKVDICKMTGLFLVFREHKYILWKLFYKTPCSFRRNNCGKNCVKLAPFLHSVAEC